MFSILNNIFDKFIFRYEYLDEEVKNHKKRLDEELEQCKKRLEQKQKRLDEDLENYKKQLKERTERFNKESNERLEQLKNKIKEEQEKLLYNNAVIIQCFIRVSYSKKEANDLRSIPDNLFDPEFSLVRKKMFNIDDSCFNKI